LLEDDVFGRIAARGLAVALAVLLVTPFAPPAPVRAAEGATITLSSPTGQVWPGLANVTWGDPFTIVATVDPDGPAGPDEIDDGTVTFTGAASGPVTVAVTDGVASTPWTLPESATISATYQGGSVYEAPPSSPYNLAVLPVPVTVGYTVAPSAPAFGEPASLAVTVDPAVPTASSWTRSDIGVGSIKVFRVPAAGDAVKVGEYLIDEGEATVALDLPANVPMPAGANDIRVEFSGDLVTPPGGTAAVRFAPGQATGSLTVAQAPATVQLSGPTTVAAGARPTYVIAVGPAAAAYPPTGIVRLFDGLPATGTLLGEWLLAPAHAGTASIDLAEPLAAGGHNLYATFDGSTPAAEDPNRLDGTSGPLSVTVGKAAQAPLVVNAPSTAVYGTEHPLSTSGGSGTGVVTYEVGSSIACAVVAGPALRITAGAGSCSITATKAADADFEAVTSYPATVTVQPAVLTVTGISASNKVYDGTTSATLNTGGATLVGRVGTDAVTLLTAGAVGTFADRNVGGGKPVAISGLTLGGTDAPNYALVQPATTAGISARPLAVSADDKSRTYGAPNPSLTWTAATLVGGDTIGTAFTTLPTCSTPATSTSGVGGHTITCSGGVAPNYAISGVPGTLSITPASSATALVRSLAATTYGDSVTLSATVTLAAPAVAGTPTGSVTFRDGLQVLGGASLVNGQAELTTSLLGAGAHASLTAVYGGDANVAGSTSPATSVTVGKAALSVAPDAQARTYGAANPVLTVSYAGFRNRESLPTSGVSGSPSCSTTATAASGIGPYPISCTGGTLASDNYSFTLAGGTLTVGRAPLTVAADDATRQYGLPNPALTATVGGFANGETAATASLAGSAACTTTALVTDDVGARPITCTAGSLAAPNYAFPTLVPGTLTIVPAVVAPLIGADVNPSPASAPVTFRATVSWPTGTPTGTVTFFAGPTDLSGPLDIVAGTAQLVTSSLEAGEHEIRAVYSGDGANFGTATSAPFLHVVGKSDVDVVVTANRTTWETNVPITFRATLVPKASGVTVPATGTITFRVDGVLRATVPVAASAASYASPPLAAGSHAVVAAYTPDAPATAVFNAGASAPLARTVVANTVSASGVGVSGSTIYPVKDGWKDTRAVRGNRLEPLSVSIRIYGPTGSRVRTKTYSRASGAYAYTWNGRTASGTILPAGRYRVVQTLTDAYGAQRAYTSYITLSRKRMYWYTRTLNVSAGPRNYQVRSTANTSILTSPSTTSTRPVVMSNAEEAPAWIAAGYQFTLPSASTYRSLSFQVSGSWTGSTAPKIGLIPWSGGDWGSIYSLTRARTAMGTSATTYYRQTLTNLAGIRSGRTVRAAIDSFAAPSGYSAGPYRYSISAVRLVVQYGILK
jgi:hypothetical protein